jgi:hypothetical protein
MMRSEQLPTEVETKVTVRLLVASLALASSSPARVGRWDTSAPQLVMAGPSILYEPRGNSVPDQPTVHPSTRRGKSRGSLHA